ncbi:hypothetical protein BJ875DRAFT_187081 [Amylocarpus encephaloides]|uniref:DUF3752 domain-containing protein n=1 Tax=Amylocarpus encephaloides TaxID=45428 RepID=A0A9P7YA62_9HELO|nr:hypothetical protein BJ875DRAFT_187081 [Amylocarpus encephaloides]
MPVGPEPPPYLPKRKRYIDDDDNTANSPPRKVQAASAPQEERVLGPAPPPSTNPDELDIGDSSQDDYGPSAPSAKAANSASTVTSPALPSSRRRPTLPTSVSPDKLDLNDASLDDEYSPLAPKLQQIKLPSPAPKRRVLGPAPPPAPLSEMPSKPANDDSSSDSEDDYGPSLPPARGSEAEAQCLHNLEVEREQEALAKSAPAQPQRDEWMLLPPGDSDWTSRVDPTKLKARKFASGKGSIAPPERGGGISAIWTETPDEKRRRLQDEVLGRAEVSLNSKPPTGGHGKAKESKEDSETATRIREYNERNRGESLVKKKEREGGDEMEEDDPSKREFDREKDMALGGRMGHVAKRDLLAKSADFGSRFQKGSYL